MRVQETRSVNQIENEILTYIIEDNQVCQIFLLFFLQY